MGKGSRAEKKKKLRKKSHDTLWRRLDNSGLPGRPGEKTMKRHPISKPKPSSEEPFSIENRKEDFRPAEKRDERGSHHVQAGRKSRGTYNPRE